MQQDLLLIGIKLDELLDKIGAVIEEKLPKTISEKKENIYSNYLSRDEVAKLLKISLPTLHQWTKLGLLQSYKIGNRVLYKQDEVEKSLHQVSNRKNKKFAL